jgi:acyl-CoA reductase-like NAD-dependent aldehyde dehydrogenase
LKRLPEWLRRLPSMPFPWPDKSRRHEAIAAARAEKARSRAGAQRAEVLRRQIEAMREQNHFAALITDDIIQRHIDRNGEGS